MSIMSTITHRITRPFVATVIAGAFLGTVGTPFFAATAAPAIAATATHIKSGPCEGNSPWPC
jgi:hypothetical protein